MTGFFHFVKTATRFLRDNAGTMMAAFALMAPVVVGTAGAAMDVAQAYSVRQRLTNALDASTLAGAASFTDEADIQERVEAFFNVNYPEGVIGSTRDLEVVVNGDDVTVTAVADYHTSFLAVIGIPVITVSETTIVHREVRGLEVVLVLDNTGSMSSNDNIDALQDATEQFINILFDATSDENAIKIGLVPYANSVRIGRYGLGMYPDGSQYGDGTVFVTLPPDVQYTTSKSSGSRWYGCVVEHNPANDDFGAYEDANYVPGTYGQIWQNDDGSWDGHGWDPTENDNDPYPQDVTDDYTGPWDIYMRGSASQPCVSYVCTRWNRWGNCTQQSCEEYGGWSFSPSSPNNGCPYAYIMPLTSDRDALLDRVEDMTPEGMTQGNTGMIWGYRLLSPEEPFVEGAPWMDNNWRKAIIMMTDGDNTKDGTYSALWDSSKNNLGVNDYNERFGEVCEAMKDRDVIIYTVTFTSNIDDDTKDYYRNCATSPAQYYDAPTQAELINVFNRISRELANLHISN